MKVGKKSGITEREKRIFKCLKCGYNAKNKNDFNAHTETQHKRKDFHVQNVNFRLRENHT